MALRSVATALDVLTPEPGVLKFWFLSISEEGVMRLSTMMLVIHLHVTYLRVVEQVPSNSEASSHIIVHHTGHMDSLSAQGEKELFRMHL